MTTLTGAGSSVEQVLDVARSGKSATSSGSAGGAVADPAQHMETLDAGSRALRARSELIPQATDDDSFHGSGGPASTGFQVEGPACRGLASRNALC